MTLSSCFRFILLWLYAGASPIATLAPLDAATTSTAALSLELWWRTPATFASEFALRMPADEEKNRSECLSADLALDISNEAPPFVGFSFRTTDALFASCRAVYFLNETLQPLELVHFVASLQEDQQVFYWNGRPIATTYESWNSFHDWNMYHVRFFGHVIDVKSNGTFRSDSVPFPARSFSLYRFTLHEKSLDHKAVLDLLRHGLPSTQQAFAVPQTILLHEDAELVPQSHELEWYRTPTPYAEAAPLEGPRILCLDCDVQRLQKAAFPNASFPALPKIYVYITELPTVGQLYLAAEEQQGIPLTSLPGNTTFYPLPPITTDDPWIRSLVYIPPHNRAVRVSFRYCVSVAVPIWNVAQCNTAAGVDIFVQPVNDPPIAIAVPRPTLAEGGTVQIPLLGTDIDDDIATVQIVTPPRLGRLLLVVTSFRPRDFLPHGTPLSQINNYTIPSSAAQPNGITVEYVWQRPPQVIVTGGEGISDVFSFRVQDRSGVWSQVERVPLHIASALTAAVENPVVHVMEGSEEAAFLSWHGSDVSRYLGRRYGFYIEEPIPSSDMGMLWNAATNQSIPKAGVTVATGASMSTELRLQPAPNACSAASNGTTTEIRFRFVAYRDNTSDVLESVSDAVSQVVVVDCARDRLALVVPAESLTVRRFSLADVTDPCAALMWSNASLPPRDCPNVVRGIQLHAGNVRNPKVVVSLSTQFGLVTLPGNRSIGMMDPIRGRPVLCAGTLTFSAYAQDAALLLSAVHYQSDRVGSDRIDIWLQEADCATCPMLRGSVRIEVVAAASKAPRPWRWHFPWSVLVCLWLYPLLYWVVVWLEQKRAPNVQPSVNDDDDDDATVQSPVREEIDRRFREHQDEDGMFYYEDTWHGTTRWDIPEVD